MRVLYGVQLLKAFFSPPLLQTYPTYSQEKSRCEYLHVKLSHIKHQILEYEKNTPT